MPESMEALVSRIDERTLLLTEKVDTLVENHEGRIRRIENKIAWVLGVGVGGGAVAGITAGFVFRVIGG